MIKRKININAVDISIWLIVQAKKKETGLLPYGYCLGGVLVSFFITVNLNDYNTAVKPPGKCRILTKKCQIVPMKCRIVPKKCQILQIRHQIMCRRSINMYWKKASLFITTAKAVEILEVKYPRARAVLLSMVESGWLKDEYDSKNL